MTDQELVLAIHDLLSGRDWNADTLQGIAGLLADNGYHVDDIADAPDDLGPHEHQKAAEEAAGGEGTFSIDALAGWRRVDV